MKNRNNCPECPFKSRTVGARGPKDAKIVIVGESPGTYEVINNTPFIGPSGELLSELLREVNIDENKVYITNAIKCLPPRSKDSKGKRVKDGVINQACKACRSNLIEEISEFDRDIIITMGTAAARSLSEIWNFSILKRRGAMFEGPVREDASIVSRLGVLPTLHPAYVLRSPSATPQLRGDLAKVQKLITGHKYPKPIIKYRILKTKQQVRKYLLECVDEHSVYPCRIIADIETTGLDRYKDDFLSIGFIAEKNLSEYDDNIVNCISLDLNLCKFLFAEAARIEKEYENKFEWVWHNGKFDTSFLRAHGLSRKQCRVDQDTLLLSYTLDESGNRHSLEQCIMDHLGLPSYKDMLEKYVGSGKKRKSYREIPTTTLLKYMSKDVVFTGLLFRYLYPRVFGDVSNVKLVGDDTKCERIEHLADVYTNLLIPASNTLATIELNGIPINQNVLDNTEEELINSLKPIRNKLVTLSGIKNYNPNSTDHNLLALRSLGLKVRATNEDEIKKYKSNEFVATLLDYRERQKQLSTYIRAFRKYGSRVHTSFLIHGTVTGRLSSTSPSMQNISKVEIMRRHFKPKPKRVFVSFDYSQAELRSLAVLSGDKNLIRIFLSGKDFHSSVAAEVYGKEFTEQSEYLSDGVTENPIYTKLRRNAKTINFGIVYGVTEVTLMERLGISWDEAHDLIINWFAMFPTAKKFMDKCRLSPQHNRPLTTVFGRQRRFYVITDSNKHGQQNEAGNFPHQSMCSDFTLASAIRIDRLYERNLLPANAQQINIIHDDNMFECDDDINEIHKLVKVVKPIMEDTPIRYGITQLPFTVDAKMGNNWGALQKIKGL